MNAETKLRIGFIGLGLMGHGMAKNVVTKGWPLTVCVHRNRKPAEDLLAAGAKEVKTHAELARQSDIVCRRGRRARISRTNSQEASGVGRALQQPSSGGTKSL